MALIRRGKERNALITLGNFYYAGQKPGRGNAIIRERLQIHFQANNAEK